MEPEPSYCYLLTILLLTTAHNLSPFAEGEIHTSIGKMRSMHPYVCIKISEFAEGEPHADTPSQCPKLCVIWDIFLKCLKFMII